MLLNCGVRENSWESLGLQRDSTSPYKRKSVLKEIRTDAEAETPIIWPPYAKNWLIRKDPDARKDWRQEEKGMTEDEMVGWHYQLDGHEFTQTHVRWVDDAIQLSQPLSSPSLPAFNLSQHQSLFQWVSSSCQVAKILEFQLQHQSF